MAVEVSALTRPVDLALAPRGVVRGALHELWVYLPAWLYFIYACLLLNTGLTNFSPPKSELAWLTVFPLLVFVVFYGVRAARAPDVQRRGRLLTTAVLLSIALPLLNWSFHRPSPLTGQSLLYVYELSNFFWAGLLFAHAFSQQRMHAALFFGAGFIYGLCLENGGILLGYFHEQNLTLTMLPFLKAPVATMIGWCVVLYMATHVVWGLREWVPALKASPLASGLLVGACAMLADLQIDPHATAMGAWVWDSSLPGDFYGVPWLNFVAWVCGLYPFAWAMFRLQRAEGIAEGGQWQWRHIISMVAAVPGALVISFLTFMVAMGLIEGINGPAYGVLHRFTAEALVSLGF